MLFGVVNWVNRWMGVLDGSGDQLRQFRGRCKCGASYCDL